VTQWFLGLVKITFKYSYENVSFMVCLPCSNLFGAAEVSLNFCGWQLRHVKDVVEVHFFKGTWNEYQFVGHVFSKSLFLFILSRYKTWETFLFLESLIPKYSRTIIISQYL